MSERCFCITIESHHICSILNDFSEAPITSINSKKSHIFFFNTPRAIQIFITWIIGFNGISLPCKYLFIPLIDYALYNSSWEGLLSSIEKRLKYWTFCTLNLLDRLVLVKLILWDILIYLFSSLASPKYFLNAIKIIQCNFLWKGTKEGIKWVLFKWEDLCNPKHVGGLGLRDPHLINQVLGANI